MPNRMSEIIRQNLCQTDIFGWGSLEGRNFSKNNLLQIVQYSHQEIRIAPSGVQRFLIGDQLNFEHIYICTVEFPSNITILQGKWTFCQLYRISSLVHLEVLFTIFCHVKLGDLSDASVTSDLRSQVINSDITNFKLMCGNMDGLGNGVLVACQNYCKTDSLLQTSLLSLVAWKQRNPNRKNLMT